MYDGPGWPCRSCKALFMVWDEEDAKKLGKFVDKNDNYIDVPCPDCGKMLNWTDIDPDIGIVE